MRRVWITYVHPIEIGILICPIRNLHRVHLVIATICRTCAALDPIAYRLAPVATRTSEGFTGLQDRGIKPAC